MWVGRVDHFKDFGINIKIYSEVQDNLPKIPVV